MEVQRVYRLAKQFMGKAVDLQKSLRELIDSKCHIDSVIDERTHWVVVATQKLAEYTEKDVDTKEQEKYV